MPDRRPVVEKYKDEADEWRWRLRAINGQIIATSGEGYVNESNVNRAVETVIRAFAECEVEMRFPQLG